MRIELSYYANYHLLHNKTEWYTLNTISVQRKQTKSLNNSHSSFVWPSHSHLGQVVETSGVKRERLMTGKHEGLL
jgi:adenine-specific DNA methylase